MKKRLFLAALLLALGAINSQVIYTGCCGNNKEQKAEVVEKPTLVTRIKDRMEKVVTAIKEKFSNEKNEEQTSTECVCDTEACLNCQNVESPVTEEKKKRRSTRNNQTDETTVQSEEEQKEETEEVVALQDNQTQTPKMRGARKIRPTMRGDCCRGCACESIQNVVEELVSSGNETLEETQEEAEALLNEIVETSKYRSKKQISL